MRQVSQLRVLLRSDRSDMFIAQPNKTPAYGADISKGTGL